MRLLLLAFVVLAGCSKPGERVVRDGVVTIRSVGTDIHECDGRKVNCDDVVVYAVADSSVEGGCYAHIAVGEIKVKPANHGQGNQKVRVHWRLDNWSSFDFGDYQFRDNDGIQLTTNNSPDEFDDKKKGNKRKFSWRSVHKNNQGPPVSYDIHLQRWDESKSRWVNCAPQDPKIVNVP